MPFIQYSTTFSGVLYGHRDRYNTYYDRPFYAEISSGSNLEEVCRQQLVMKNQRTAAQSKRHKSRRIHVPVNKDVSQKILNFINRTVK
jgi:hypothetical protein